jgi:predicted nucleic acid-binding protein
MRQRVYIDTSVFGGYFDDEFSAHTIPLFNRLKNNEFTLLFSTVTQDELENAPE